MRRSICLLLAAAFVVSVTGCKDGVQLAQKVLLRNDRKADAVPRRLIDPLERDEEIRAMIRPVIFDADGKDNLEGDWKGYLIVETAENAYLTSGFFEWTRENPHGGGRYHFKGTYDPETREVHWTGFTITDRILAANAIYTATLSPDGSKFLDGSWAGGIAIPGTWTASRTDGIGE